jgi:hypothetical protein
MDVLVHVVVAWFVCIIPAMKKLAMIVLSAVALLAGCQDPVDPAKIKIYYGAQKVTPKDKIWIMQDRKLSSDLQAEPGQKISLAFFVVNTVRDEVFIQMDDSAAYVASLVIFQRGESQPLVVPMNAPIVNPAASAGSYKRLLKFEGADEGPDRSLSISLPVDLPKVNWEKIEISVVFSIRGYTRETRGEFRDTITNTYAITRKNPSTHPAPVPANTGMYLRPGANPATMP